MSEGSRLGFGVCPGSFAASYPFNYTVVPVPGYTAKVSSGTVRSLGVTVLVRFT